VLVALLAALLVVLAVPITRSQAGAAPAPAIDAEARTEEALTSVLHRQAESVSAMVAPATPPSEEATTLAQDGGLADVLIPDPLLAAMARLATRGALGGGEGAPALAVPLQAGAFSFTLHENGFASQQASSHDTVGEALAAAGIELGSADIVQPAADTPLTAGLHVFVDYAAHVRVLLGDDDINVETQAMTVGGMFAEQGIEVQPSDVVFPPAKTKVRRGMVVSLTLVRDVLVHEDIPVAFRSISRYDHTLPIGQKVVVQAGVNGAQRTTYSAHMVNSNEVSRALVGQETIAPTDEIVLLGTYQQAPVMANDAAAPGEGECRSYMNVWSTYYTAASAGGTVTRTGTGVYKGIVAVDPNVIPLGTRMYVPGYGYGLAADTGGGVIGAHIDLAYGANDVYDWGSRYVQICILG
jgi:3D (Asp-Asp-Asp) domain-containing protein